jgi:glutamate 5-kinase
LTGDVIRICDTEGTEFARGIAKFSHEEMEDAPGKVVVHRDHLVVL